MKRRIVRKRKSGKPRKRLARASPAKGQIYIKRNAQSVVIRNTAVAGTPIVNGYNGAAVVNNLVQLGTPEADGNYSHSIYNVPFSCQFSLNQVIANTEFTAIADRYCIKHVAIKVKYNANTMDAGISTTLLGNQPSFKYITDFDDSTPLSVNNLQQKMGLRSKLLGANKYVTLALAPRTTTSVLGGAATSALVNRSGLYVDMNQTDVPHYGVKGYIEGLNLQATSQLDSLVQFEFVYTLVLKDIQ